MPVPELEKFRQKFPDYDDLPDDVLAARLATKYPEYADLPGKVQAAQGGEATSGVQEPPEPSSFPQALGLGLRDTAVAAWPT